MDPKLLKELVDIMYSPVPMPASEVARRLVSKGVYKTRPDILATRIKKPLAYLVSDGQVIEIKPGDKGWDYARGLARTFLKIKPRRVSSLFQAHFLAGLARIPDIDPIFNMSVMAFIAKYKITDRMHLLNFVLCGKDSRVRDEMRIFLYKQPLDYDEIELMEGILDYGVNLSLPFKPDLEKAKEFVRSLNTGSKGAPTHKKRQFT